jgi:cysteine desulfurase
MVGSVVASHVLLAMGLPVALAGSAVRFSLGHETTEAEVDRAGDIIARVMNHMMSTRSSSKTEAYAVV